MSRVRKPPTRANSQMEEPMMDAVSLSLRAPVAMPISTADACGQSQNDTGDSLHHLAADGDSGHACCVVKLSHYEEVCASVKGLQHIGQQIGEGELKQYAGYISLCQISFFIFLFVLSVFDKKKSRIR